MRNHQEVHEGYINSNTAPTPSYVDWSEGAFVPKSRKCKYAKDVPWYTVEDHPDYECRYHPYSTLSVREKRNKVECIQRMWDWCRPDDGKYVHVWKDGKKIKVDTKSFEKYRTNNKKRR